MPPPTWHCALKRIQNCRKFSNAQKVVTPKCPPGVLALTPHEIGQYEYSNDGFALAGVTWPQVCWNWV